MALLNNNKPISLSAGKYYCSMSINSGNVNLEYKTKEMNAFVPIHEPFTSSIAQEINIPDNCEFKAVFSDQLNEVIINKAIKQNA